MFASKRVKWSSKMVSSTCFYVIFSCCVVICACYTHKIENPQCNAPYEELQCVKPCPPEPTCKNRDIKFSCFDDGKPCQQKCVCKKGYYRNATGECISLKECENPQKCNGQYEELVCVKDCPPEITCRLRGAQFKCRADNKPCQNKCYCKTGYYRNAIGDCISGTDCDKCQGLHEYFSCGSACDNTCADPSQNKTNCDIVNIVCNPKCYCEDGFARDNNNICIPFETCPQENTCNGPNEEYVLSRKNCPTDMCSSLVERRDCTNVPYVSGCTCKPGFLRKDANSSCLPICDCPQMNNSPDCKK